VKPQQPCKTDDSAAWGLKIAALLWMPALELLQQLLLVSAATAAAVAATVNQPATRQVGSAPHFENVMPCLSTASTVLSWGG
jgi:hypothetical protein